MEEKKRVRAKKNKRKTVEYDKYGYLFIAPFFIIYAIFQLWPLIYTVYLSFMENYYRGLNQVGPNFIGLKNYIAVLFNVDKNYNIIEGSKIFDTATFSSLYNTVFMWLFNFIPQILMSLLLAAWFTDTKVKLKGQGGFKIMIFLPNIITAASIAVLFYSLFSFPSGPISVILRDLGIINPNYDFMQSKTATRLLIAFIQFWMWYGNTMIVLIAGILGISPSLFEAAMVDGATSKQIFRLVTLPLLKPILLFTLVTSAIGGLQMYDIPALFNVDGNSGDALPDYASQTITMYIRKIGLGTKNLGKAAASSMVLFVVTLIISMIFFYIFRDKDDIQEKKARKKGA